MSDVRVKVSEETRKKAKMLAALMGVSMKEAIDTAVDDRLSLAVRESELLEDKQLINEDRPF